MAEYPTQSPVRCSRCCGSIWFDSVSDLIDHMRSSHRTDDYHGSNSNEVEEELDRDEQEVSAASLFRCSRQECGNEQFDSESELLEHLNSSHGVCQQVAGPKFNCNFCHRNFDSYSECVLHRYIHLGVKPFQCPTCPQSFRRPDQLELHCRAIHYDERPWKCEMGACFECKMGTCECERETTSTCLKKKCVKVGACKCKKNTKMGACNHREFATIEEFKEHSILNHSVGEVKSAIEFAHFSSRELFGNSYDSSKSSPRVYNMSAAVYHYQSVNYYFRP